MAAIELVKDREKKTPAHTLRSDLVLSAFQKGLLLLGCGANSIRFCPPLTVSADEIDTGLGILEEVLKATEKGGSHGIDS
jgi:4-aminobutyrate aminotransferase